MKRAIAFVAAITVTLFASHAFADILAQDDFTYPDGNLVGNGGWANHSGTASFIQVASGEAVVGHGGGSREDASIMFAAQSSGIVSYNFDFSVDDLGAAFGGTDFEYFAHFGPGSSNFTARLDLVAPSAAGDFSIGLATFSSTADVTWGSDFSYGEVINVNVDYDIDNDTAFLSVNGGTALQAAIGTATQTIDAFAFRQSDSSNDEVIRIDNLLIQNNNQVPEPTSMGVLAILAGFGLIRRRK